MIKNIASIIIFSFLMLYTVSSFAFVVQDAKNAMSFNNVSRSISVADNKTDKNSSGQTSFYDDSIDYDEIGAKLINKKQQKKYIDLSLQTTKNIKMPKGYSFFIILPEKEGCLWHTDSNEKIIIPASTNKEGENRIIEFESVGKGTTRIFLDNVCNKNNNSKGIQSRIIRVKVN